MSLSDDLLQHALLLVGDPVERADREVGAVHLRRALSACYYALFHHLSEACLKQIAPSVSDQAANRIYRWLDHGEMKKICREFSSASPKQPLRDLLETELSPQIQTLALTFIKLQEARHAADYDPTYEIDRKEVNGFIASAMIAIQGWEGIKHTAEGNIFILSLLLWKNWEKERK